MGQRDLTLKPRKEDIRAKIQPQVIVFPLNIIKEHFDESMLHIHQQHSVAQMLIDSGRIVDGENIWRSQIVLLSSALDFYLHEITKFGLERIFSGDWFETEKYMNLKIDMTYVKRALNNLDNIDWFTEYINNEFSKVSMMSYEVIKNQLNLIGLSVQDIADKAFYVQGGKEKTGEKMKRRLTELYFKRNLIAHQSDRNDYNAERKTVSKELVESFIDDIEKIVAAIHAVALEK